MGGVPVSAASRDEPIALALGAGGARGLAQIGVIEALQARGLRIVAISGASSGALVGGACAAPLSAWLVRYLPARTVMASVAIVVLGLSGWQLAQVLAG